MKLCKDCAHFSDGAPTHRGPYCLAPAFEEPRDLIYGHRPLVSAVWMRNKIDKCGTNAVHFVAKRPWWRLW